MNVHNLSEVGVEEDMGNSDFSPGTTEEIVEEMHGNSIARWAFSRETSQHIRRHTQGHLFHIVLKKKQEISSEKATR